MIFPVFNSLSNETKNLGTTVVFKIRYTKVFRATRAVLEMAIDRIFDFHVQNVSKIAYANFFSPCKRGNTFKFAQKNFV